MKGFVLLAFIATLTLLFSCGAKAQTGDSELFAKLKDDAYYYKGLMALDEGDEEKASAYFSRCIQMGSKYCAQKSLDEYNKLQLKDTTPATPLMEKAQLIDWYTSGPLSAAHLNYYEEHLAQSFDTPPVVNFRVEVAKRDYAGAYNTYKISAKTFFMTPELYRDAGKMFLYVSNMYAGNAKYFESFVRPAQDESNFYVYFYSGRMKVKAGDFDGAKASFNNAIKCAARLKDAAVSATKKPDKIKKVIAQSIEGAVIERRPPTLTEAQKLFDNALWYLIDTGFKVSLDEGILLLKSSAEEFCDAHYFDDIFNTLLLDLINQKAFDQIYDIATTTKGKASADVTARYSYIYARFLGEGLIPNAKGSLANQKKLCEKLFNQALTTDNDIYYKIMSLYNLNKIKKIKKFKAKSVQTLFKTPTQEKTPPDEDAGTFLAGFVTAALYNKVYGEYISMVDGGVVVDTDVALGAAKTLCEEGVIDNKLYPQSLRIAVRAMKNPTRALSKRDFRLLYPKDYKGIVETFSTHYGIPKSIMYALIRSESFFSSDVISSANAKGLCQLMDMTALDIARKLKVKDFDITNPETNVEFGCYYLAELNHRLDGRWLPTFFSYNAGIGRVRKWQKDAYKLFGRDYISDDLLLEMLPYEETREYGKKLVTATVMYEILWEGKTIDEVFKEVL